MRKASRHSYSVRSLIAATGLLVSLFNTTMSFGQTCTIAGAATPPASTNINWNNAINTGAMCTDGTYANAASIIIIPDGVTLIFGADGDFWQGTRIEVYGLLNVTNGGASNGTVTINADILVKPAGEVRIHSKLLLGNDTPPPDCPYSLVLEDNTAILNMVGTETNPDATPAEKLRICNKEIVRGGDSGACNDLDEDPPYCEPDIDGFPGPIVFDYGGAGPLPVDLLFFKAFSSPNGVDLKWATASEKGSHYFAIEKSLNGKNFTEIGRVDASGNRIARMDYSFFDDNALLGRNYYRLKAVDFDGTYEYFNITFADTDGTRAVSLYPNPVQHSRIQFKLNFSSDEQSHAKIYNSTGALVNSFSFSGSHYNEESNLRPGAYIMKVSVGKELFTQRFVIP
jgi:hypothetical protein